MFEATTGAIKSVNATLWPTLLSGANRKQHSFADPESLSLTSARRLVRISIASAPNRNLNHVKRG
jgi:hypothetical protein